MKIAYLMSRFPKLTETFIVNEAIQLRRQGVELRLYPLIRQRARVIHPQARALLPQVRFLPFFSIPVLQAQWYFLRNSPGRYLRVLFELLRETWGSLNFCFGALAIFPKTVRLALELKDEGFDHVHAHFANHPAAAAFIIHRLTGLPYSFTAHGSDLHVEQRMLETKVRHARFVVTISAYNRDFLLKACGEELGCKVHVVRCGVDLRLFQPRPRDNGSGPLRILSVGSLSEVKGHAYLVEACRILAHRGVPFTCRVIGEGPLRPSLNRQIRRSGLQDRVFLVGEKTGPEVLEALQESDTFVLASVPTRNGKREGIPVALMEAMAGGLPVIASSLSGIPELVESGKSGILVPPRDARGLAAALEEIYRDLELRRRLGQQGRLRVLQDFNLDRNCFHLLQLFATGGQSSWGTSP